MNLVMLVSSIVHKVNIKLWNRNNGDDNLTQFFQLDDMSNYNSYVYLDIGTHLGELLPFAIVCERITKIVAYEPYSVYCENIRNKFKVDHLFIVQGAVSSFDGQCIFTEKGTSSYIEPIRDTNKNSIKLDANQELVPIYDISRIFTQNSAYDILLKINIEGGEYLLLQRLIETDQLKNASKILIQFHGDTDLDTIKQRYSIRNYLKHSHSLVFKYSLVWELWSKQ